MEDVVRYVVDHAADEPDFFDFVLLRTEEWSFDIRRCIDFHNVPEVGNEEKDDDVELVSDSENELAVRHLHEDVFAKEADWEQEGDC